MRVSKKYSGEICVGNHCFRPSKNMDARVARAQASLLGLEQRWLKLFVPDTMTTFPLIRSESNRAMASELDAPIERPTPASAAVLRDGGLAVVKKEITTTKANATGTLAEEEHRLCKYAHGRNMLTLLSTATGKDSAGPKRGMVSVGTRQIRTRPAAAVDPASGRPVETRVGRHGQACVGGRQEESRRRRGDEREAGVSIGGDGVGREELHAYRGGGGSRQSLRVLTPPPALQPGRPSSSGGDRGGGDTDGVEQNRVGSYPTQELQKHGQYRCRHEHGGPEPCSVCAYDGPYRGQCRESLSSAEHSPRRQNQPEQPEGGDGRRGDEVNNNKNTAVALLALANTLSAGDDVHGHSGGCDNQDSRPGCRQAADFPGRRDDPMQTQEAPCPRSSTFEANWPYGPAGITSYAGPGRGYDNEYLLCRDEDGRIGVGETVGTRGHAKRHCGGHQPIDIVGADLHYSTTGYYLDYLSPYQVHFNKLNGGDQHSSSSNGSSSGGGGGWGPPASAAVNSPHPDRHGRDKRGTERRTGPFRPSEPPPPLHLRTCNNDHLFFPGDTRNLRAIRQDRNPEQHILAAVATKTGLQWHQQQQQPFSGALGLRAAVKLQPREVAMAANERESEENPTGRLNPDVNKVSRFTESFAQYYGDCDGGGDGRVQYSDDACHNYNSQ